MVFGIDSLAPEREPFELEDGEIIYFVSKAEFSTERKSKLRRLTRSSVMADKKFDKARNDEDREKIMGRIKTMTEQVVKLILPDLPDDVLGEMTMGQLDMIVNYWTEVNKTDAEEN